MRIPESDPSDRDYKPSTNRSQRDEVVNLVARQSRLAEKFWVEWTQTYLTFLRDSNRCNPLYKVASRNRFPKKNEVVLIIDDNDMVPRHQWPIGVVTKVNRTGAIIRAPTGRLIERPINMLIPLELCGDDDDEDDAPDEQSAQAHQGGIQTRAMRKAAARNGNPLN